MSPRHMLDYAAEVAKAWRDEEWDALVVGNAARAINAHQGAIVLEQYVHDMEAQLAGQTARRASRLRSVLVQQIGREASQTRDPRFLRGKRAKRVLA